MAVIRNLSILVISLAVVGTALFSTGATAQSSDCTSTLVSLSPCLNYITGNSSSPSSSCCTQLGSVVKSKPECLCQVINGGGGNLGIEVNQTQAMALPGACKVQTPPTSQCNAAGSPSGSPNTPSGTGGGSTGSSPDGTSSSSADGNSAKLTFCLVFVMLFAASYSSI
ncbi:Non-specific lipid transfer protein GPI-anchored 5 [Linum grandiflorum]